MVTLMVLVRLWPRRTNAKFLILAYSMVQLRNEVKVDKICLECEKIGYHENSKYFFQLLD